MSKDLYPRFDLKSKLDPIEKELTEGRAQLTTLVDMLDSRTVDKYYILAMKGICGGGLLGLSLMMVATLITAVLLTILVCVDSHTWIYLSKR